MSLKNSKRLPNSQLTEQEFLALGQEHQVKYLSLLEKEVQYRKSQRILYYEPHQKQEIFHKHPASIRAIFGGNRSGKTTAGGMEFLYHVTGVYPKWYPKEQRYDRSVIGRIAAQDFQKGVGEVILKFFEEWLDPSLVVKKTKNPMGVPIKWELKNGSVFDILTYEQSTESFEGWKGDIVWFDEPPPRDKYIATLRGLIDRAGRCWLTLTPLKQAWIYDDIYTAADGDYIFVVTVDMSENPHLGKKEIENFVRSLNEEEKEARLHGKFMHLSGLIYKEFGEHNIAEAPKIDKDWTRYFAIDLHDRTPAACMWFAVDNHGTHWVYDELWLGDVSLAELAAAIHAQEGDFKPLVRFIDPAMDKENELAGGFNPRKELMKHGIFCQRANNDPYYGKSRIREALRPQYSAMYERSLPQLRISRWCPKTIYEFQHYLWDEFVRDKSDRDPKQKPKKLNDHFMDCLRYIYNSNPIYRAKVEEDSSSNIEYKGEFTKYPVSVEKSGYHSLVERK